MWQWSIHDTITGEFRQWVYPSSSSWGRQINAAQEGQQTEFPWDPLLLPARDLLRPWSRTIVQSRNGRPVYAGVICATPKDDDDAKATTIQHVDVRALLRTRTTFGANGYSGSQVGHNLLKLEGFSGPAMVAALVFVGMLSTAGNAALPIDLPFEFPAGLAPTAPPAGGAGTYTRTWYDYNFPYIDEAITEVQNYDGGPDVELEPYFVDGTNQMRWRLRAGVLTGPTFEWRMAADEPGLLHVQRSGTDDQQITAGVVSGDGQEIDLLVATAALPATDLPLIEADEQVATEKKPAVLQGHADAMIADRGHPRFIWSASVHAATLDELGPGLHIEDMRLGSVHRLEYRGHPVFPDGFHDCRLVQVTGDETELINLIFDQEAAA